MPFPTSETCASDAARIIFMRAKRIRDDCVTYIAQCDASALNLASIAGGFLANLAGVKGEFTTFNAIEGLAAELSRQRPTALADASAAQTAFDAARTAIDTTITWLEANIPMDDPATTRRVLAWVLSNNGSGTLTGRIITNAGQLAAFKAQLQTLRDAFSA